MGRGVGTVVELWRYPVKSLLGESVPAATLADDGIPGDRGYGLRDVSTDRILSAKVAPALFGARAELEGTTPVIVLPDGERVAADDPDAAPRLSAWLGREVGLEKATTSTADRSYERLPHHFFDEAQLHLLTLASLAAAAPAHPDGVWDRRRFRPNVVLDVTGEGFVEDAWVDRRVTVGDAELQVVKRTNRCVMTTHAQQELPADGSILRSLGDHHGSCLGVFAAVVRPGSVAIGDPVDVSF